jgi:hypothetical protein
MATEKQNEPVRAHLGWKNQLDQLKLVPDQDQIDKEQAWGKLHERLKAETHPKKYSIYWVIAACFFCLFVILGIKIIEQENSPVKKTISAKHSISNITSPPLMDNLSPALVPAKNEIAHIPEFDRGPSLHPRSKLPGIAIQEGNSPEISTAFSKVRSRVFLSDVFISPIKRALQVIPLNESGFSIDPNLSSVRPFKLKIYNPANLNLPSFADEQQGQPTLKIKLAAQN